MKFEIPGTAREIVKKLAQEYNLTIKKIAEMLKVTPKTVYRIRNGYNPQPATHINLIQLYINLSQTKQTK